MSLDTMLKVAQAEQEARSKRPLPVTVPSRPSVPKKDSGEDPEEYLKTVANELARRSVESLYLYEPLEHIEPFHACRAPDRILRGSNRAGKTLGAAVEFARAVTGQDPHNKYPKREGRAFIVGKDGKHNAEVLYRKLFRRGAYHLIPDKDTGLWRPYRPWEPSDKEREPEAQKAPPLIPPRMIKEFSWENKKDQVPNICRLTNGWEIRVFSSLGSPPQGSDIDLAWFDEEIVNPEWYPEISARLIDRRGKFFWSATAQLGGAQLYELSMKAGELLGTENARVQEFFAHLDDNPHFDDDQRELFFSKLSEEQIKIRIDGEFAFTFFKVYPEYSSTTHGFDCIDIPDDWTRYMVVDPGRQVAAVLFAAVPPPDHKLGGHVILYDEIYVRNADARTLAEKVRQKTTGQHFYAFIIDHQGSRVRSAETGIQIEDAYEREFKAAGIKSQTTGHGFHWGASDVAAGLEVARSWMVVGSLGVPKLKVMHERMKYFAWEIERYHYKRDRGKLTDKPEQKNNHLMDCYRYLAMFDPQWHELPSKAKKHTLPEFIRAKQRRKAAKDGGGGHVSLGPQGGKEAWL